MTGYTPRQPDMFEDDPKLKDMSHGELSNVYEGLFGHPPEPGRTREELISAAENPEKEIAWLNRDTLTEISDKELEKLYKEKIGVPAFSMNREDIERAIRNPEIEIQRLREQHKKEDDDDMRNTYQRSKS